MVFRTVDNIYMGFGHKYVSRNVTPALLPPIQAQFIMSAEIMEMNDPRTQEENLLN